MDLLLYTRDESNKPYFNDTLRLGNTYRLSRIDAMPNYYRIQATFSFRPQTQEYPRDKQSLQIVIESERFDVTEQIYYELENISGISPQMRLRGWEFNSSSWQITIGSLYYPAERRAYSQLTFTFFVNRPIPLSIKSFLPPSFIMVSALISFSIPISNVVGRLGILTSSLVAQVYFHSGMNVPFTGAIMIADWFMIICYAIIILGIIENIGIIVLQDNKKHRHAVPFIERRARILVWLIFPTLYFFLFLEPYYAVIVLVAPTGLYVGIGYLWFYQKKKDAAKRLKKSNKRREAQDEEMNDVERQDAHSTVDAISNQDMRAQVIRREVEQWDGRTRSDVLPEQDNFGDSVQETENDDDLPAARS
jgi:hypothetical protein